MFAGLLRQGAAQGARSTIFAATAPELSGFGGAYLGPPYISQGAWGAEQMRPPANPLARDPTARSRLFEEAVAVLQAKCKGVDVPSLPGVSTRV